jgi:hypothetical protein
VRSLLRPVIGNVVTVVSGGKSNCRDDIISLIHLGDLFVC